MRWERDHKFPHVHFQELRNHEQIQSIAIGTVAAAFGLVVALTVPALASSTSLTTLIDAPWADDPEGCTYTCRECVGPPTSTAECHDIVTSTDNHHKSSHLENCNEGSCSKHSCGNAAMASAADVWKTARNARGRELLALVASDTVRIRFNQKRGALQLYCDTGALIASLPLTGPQVGELSRIVSTPR